MSAPVPYDHTRRPFLSKSSLARDSAVATVALSSILLLGAALYNGYPLTFWDTRAYVEHAGSLLPRTDRLIGYSVFIRAFSFHGSLWPVVIAQCALVAWLLARLSRSLVGSSSGPRQLALIFFLTSVTALPWISGQLMPDVFAPILVIALFLLVETDARDRFEKGALLGIVAGCVGIHLTHFPMGIGLCLVAWRVHRGADRGRALARVGPPLAALVVGLVAIAGFNGVRTGRVSLASGSDAFILGHLVESGIASKELDEHCPERAYLLCPYRRSLPMPADDFLWVDRLDLHPWENADAIRVESRRLFRDSLREHPLLHARVFIEYTVAALFAVGTGEGLDGEAQYLVEPQIARYAPRDVAAYRAARQQFSAVPLAAIRGIQTPIAIALVAVGAVALAVLSLRGRIFRDPASRFLAFSCAALVLNAVLTGNISGVHDRYGARLAWIVAVALWALWVEGSWTRARSRSSVRALP